MALGAIIKSAGGALVKQQGKKLAADKLMGRGRKKTRGGKQQTPDQKKQVAQNIMSSRAGGSVTPQVVSSTPFDSVSPSSSGACLLYTSPSPRDKRQSRMPSSA